MNLSAKDLWGRYGLTQDPYFIQPIGPADLQLFKGTSRREAADRLVGHIRAGGTPLLLLEGGPGEGKTSIVNVAKSTLAETGEVFVYPRAIEISRDSSRETIAAEYLAALTTTALATDPGHPWAKDPRWVEAHEMIADTWRSTGKGGGLAFAGFGANLALSQIRQVARQLPWATWRAILRNILDAMLETEGRTGVVVHLNNIDAVSDEAPDHVRDLLDEVRELLIEPGLTTVLCASQRFRAEVVGDRARLLDVLTSLPPLRALPENEFLDAVHARYTHFAVPGHFVVHPVHDEAMKSLYDTFLGDMRSTFQVARFAVVESSLSGANPVPLSRQEVLALNGPRLELDYSNLAQSEQAIIAFLLEHGTSDSQQAIQEAKELPQPTLSHATQRLENRRWISTERVGRQRSYALAGYGTLLRDARQAGFT